MLCTTSGARQAGAPLAAAERAFADAAVEAFEPSVGRAASLLASVPAAIALALAYHAYLRGDARGTAFSYRGPWPIPVRASGCWIPGSGGTVPSGGDSGTSGAQGGPAVRW